MNGGYFDVSRVFDVSDCSSGYYLQRMEGLEVSIETSENLGVAEVEQLPKGLELGASASGHRGVFCILLGLCSSSSALRLVVNGGQSIAMLYHLLRDYSLGGDCISGKYF